MKKLVRYFLFVCCLVPYLALSQNPQKATALSKSLLPLIESLSRTNGNLIQMAKGEQISAKDGSAVHVFLSPTFQTNLDHTLHVRELAWVYSTMKSDEDRKIIGQLLEVHIAEEKGNCESYPPALNKWISGISNAALLSEARQGRDLTQQICAALNSW